MHKLQNKCLLFAAMRAFALQLWFVVQIMTNKNFQ